MEEIGKQLEEIKGSVKIINKWIEKERADQIKEEIINEFFNFHKNLFVRDLNKIIKDKLGN